jgi:hypothetical protein
MKLAELKQGNAFEFFPMFLDFPNALPFDTEVNDLGYAGVYSRLPE